MISVFSVAFYFLNAYFLGIRKSKCCMPFLCMCKSICIIRICSMYRKVPTSRNKEHPYQYHMRINTIYIGSFLFTPPWLVGLRTFETRSQNWDPSSASTKLLLLDTSLPLNSVFYRTLFPFYYRLAFPSLLLNPFGAVRVLRTAFACGCTSRGMSVSITSQVKGTPPGARSFE